MSSKSYISESNILESNDFGLSVTPYHSSQRCSFMTLQLINAVMAILILLQKDFAGRDENTGKVIFCFINSSMYHR